MLGRDLKARLSGMGDKELCDILMTLTSVGYVSSSQDIESKEDVVKASFFVNPGYAKDIKEAIDPEPKPTNKRVRRQ